MIRYDVEQGSPEWFKLRLGIPTSSDFDKIITPAKGDLSKSARKYAYYLVAEALMGEPMESVEGMQWMERGKLLEPQAAQHYCFSNSVEVMRAGFITTDDGRMGCSPDRLIVGANGGLEIKCPAPQTHIGYKLDGPGHDYRAQVQGQLLIAELDWVDFVSFHPAMPHVQIRTYRDEEYIEKMIAALDEFCDLKDEMLERMRSSGFIYEAPKVLTPAEQAWGSEIQGEWN